jgi:hypothetical protein
VEGTLAQLAAALHRAIRRRVRGQPMLVGDRCFVAAGAHCEGQSQELRLVEEGEWSQSLEVVLLSGGL